MRIAPAVVVLAAAAAALAWWLSDDYVGALVAGPLTLLGGVVAAWELAPFEAMRRRRIDREGKG